MKLLLVSLLALSGNFAIAASVKAPTLQSTPNAVDAMQSKSQLIQSIKVNFREANLLQSLKEKFENVDKYAATYSPKVQTLVNEMRPYIIVGDDNVFDAIKTVYGWCSTTKDLLRVLLGLPEQNDGEIPAIRNSIIGNIINNDFSGQFHEKLKQLMGNLNKALSSVTSILTEIDLDFTEQSDLFKTLLNHEIIKDKNTRYIPDLINTAVVTSTRMAQAAGHTLSSLDDPLSSAGQAHQQQQQNQPTTEPSANNQYQSTTTSTIDPQLYLPNKNRVFKQFQHTRAFINSLKYELDRTISRVHEVESKFLENHSVAPAENTIMTRENQLNNAARALLNKCENFIDTPLI